MMFLRKLDRAIFIFAGNKIVFFFIETPWKIILWTAEYGCYALLTLLELWGLARYKYLIWRYRPFPRDRF
jgi:hypothetical protein